MKNKVKIQSFSDWFKGLSEDYKKVVLLSIELNKELIYADNK